MIAYEPVWAIGTGVTASPEQAQETHKAIRGWIAGAVDQKTADEIRIQYGGSANAKNAPDLSARCPSPFPSPPSLLPTHSTALALVGDSGRGGS